MCVTKDVLQRLRDLKGEHVLLVGEPFVDEYIYGSVKRFSRAAPVPVVNEETREWEFGGAANIAANFSAIGVDTRLVGLLGSSDREGSFLINLLERRDIRTDGIVRSNVHRTARKTRVMGEGHQMLRIDCEDFEPISRHDRLEFYKKIDECAKKAMVVAIADFAQRTVDVSIIQYVLKVAREKNISVIATPRGPEFAKYSGVDYLKLNRFAYADCARQLGLEPSASISKNGVAICEKLSCTGVFITLGGDGIHYVSKTEECVARGFKHEVYEATGAGGVAFSYIASSLAAGLTVREAIHIANNAASISVRHKKSYPVSLDELEFCGCEGVGRHTKVFRKWATVKRVLGYFKNRNKRVVFTTVNIVDAGHGIIEILERARSHGDVLVVALGGDGTTEERERSGKLLSALECVDFMGYLDHHSEKEVANYLCPDVCADETGGVNKRFVVTCGAVRAQL
ncbi:hypothetical protein HOD08_03410 [bacterium]|jgi:D-beta-D-heptose 7-phosphate kinase / D-beta-D-heptose 1-phosphate adenosyltransferase|nr:hypothetical protein [bacterium]